MRIDYSTYTYQELPTVVDSIDREKFPDRYAEASKYLREKNENPDETDLAFERSSKTLVSFYIVLIFMFCGGYLLATGKTDYRDSWYTIAIEPIELRILVCLIYLVISGALLHRIWNKNEN